jgi:hypothetical protein
MKNIQTKIIANEFDISPNMINYKIESHFSKKSSESKVLNEAELLALKQEQMRLEEEIKKKKSLEEGNQKIKENLKNYKEQKRQKIQESKQMKMDKKIKQNRLKNYNTEIREKFFNKKKNFKQFCNNSSTNIIYYDPEINQEERQADLETFSFNNGNMEQDDIENEPNPIQKVIPTNIIPSNVINIRDDIDHIIREKLFSLAQKNICPGENIDVNINLSNLNIGESLSEELKKKLENVKEFRKTGLFSTKSSRVVDCVKSNNETKMTKLIEEQTKKKNELEKRRYSIIILFKFRYLKALKNLMTERFKEKSIIIPNICSCGQLQKKLDTLLEDRNVSVYSVINIECANNCIYYNNTHEYHKALSDIIHSVKNLKFDSFLSNKK